MYSLIFRIKFFTWFHTCSRSIVVPKFLKFSWIFQFFVVTRTRRILYCSMRLSVPVLNYRAYPEFFFDKMQFLCNNTEGICDFRLFLLKYAKQNFMYRIYTSQTPKFLIKIILARLLKNIRLRENLGLYWLRRNVCFEQLYFISFSKHIEPTFFSIL